MQMTDMVMHVDESLAADSRRNLERTMTSQRGVLDAHFNERRPHLMLVSYDRDRTSSFDILAVMTGQRLCAEPAGHHCIGELHARDGQVVHDQRPGNTQQRPGFLESTGR